MATGAGPILHGGCGGPNDFRFTIYDLRALGSQEVGEENGWIEQEGTEREAFLQFSIYDLRFTRGGVAGRWEEEEGAFMEQK